MSDNIQGVGVGAHYPQQPVVITKQPIIQHVVHLECKRGVQQGLFSRVADFAVRSCIAGFTAGAMMAACRVAAAHVMGAPSQAAINEMIQTSIGMGAGLGVFAALTTSVKGDAALRGMEFGAAGAAVFMAAGGNDKQVLQSATQARNWAVLRAGEMQTEAGKAFRENVSEPFSKLEMPTIRLPDFFGSEEKELVCPQDMVCLSKTNYDNLIKAVDARRTLETYQQGFAVYEG